MNLSDQIRDMVRGCEIQIEELKKALVDECGKTLRLESQLEEAETLITQTSHGAAARIAELEAQIAAASAPVVEQQPLGYIPKWAHDMLTGEMGGMSDWGCNAHIYAAEAIGHIPIYTAPRITDPDKLREAIANISNNQITEAWESCGGVDGFYKSFGYQQFAHAILNLAADTVASTALQAPVREVPKQRHVYDWLHLVETKIGTPTAASAARVLKEFYEGAEPDEPLPAAPVQEPKP